MLSLSTALLDPRPQTTANSTLWTREISLDLWVCVKYILINLSSDDHYLMGLRRDTIPSPQSTVTAVFTMIEPSGSPSDDNFLLAARAKVAHSTRLARVCL